MNYDDVELMKVKIKANKNIEFFIKDEVLDQFKEEFRNIKLNGLFFSFDNDNSSKIRLLYFNCKMGISKIIKSR